MKLIRDPVDVLTVAVVALLWAVVLWIIGLPWWLTVVAGVAVVCVLHRRDRRAR